jgi:NADH-quinone oxidoreductase subunit M
MNPLILASASAATPDFPILPVLVFTPFLGAIILVLLPRSRPDVLKAVAVLFSVVVGVMTIYLLTQFAQHDAGFQFESQRTWIGDLGISWRLGVDGISLFLVVLTGVLWPIVFLAIEPEHDPKRYYAWLLVLQGGCLGVFLALDLFLFFVMFEIVLVPMYMLIGGWGHGRRVYAATKFFLYTMFGSALMLVGIVSLAVLSKAGPGGSITFDLQAIAEHGGLAVNTGRLIFVTFAVAFAIKVPIFPLHTWLPDAHTEAPTAGSVILAGVMLKLGTYGFIRFGLYLFPEASAWAAPVMITLGVIGIIYGAIAATMQHDFKRLVAYSSVAHLGFIVVGIFALNTQGIEGGIVQMVNHGISTGALFLLVGMIYERRHTREISELKGLQKVAPLLAAVFTVVMFSSIGVPGLNGFVGEYLTLIGLFLAHRWWAVVAASGVILAALYLLWAYQRVFHGEPDEANRDMPDMRPREFAVMVPLLALVFFMGLYPKPVLDRMEPSVKALVAHIEQATGTPAPDTTGGADLAPVADEGHGGGRGEAVDKPAESHGEEAP